jgi:hypothetical protein
MNGDWRCLLLAQSGHGDHAQRCPLLGVKRTSAEHAGMSAFDPKRTFGLANCCFAKLRRLHAVTAQTPLALLPWSRRRDRDIIVTATFEIEGAPSIEE